MSPEMDTLVWYLVLVAGQLGMFPSRHPSQLGLGSSRPGPFGDENIFIGYISVCL